MPATLNRIENLKCKSDVRAMLLRGVPVRDIADNIRIHWGECRDITRESLIARLYEYRNGLSPEDQEYMHCLRDRGIFGVITESDARVVVQMINSMYEAIGLMQQLAALAVFDADSAWELMKGYCPEKPSFGSPSGINEASCGAASEIILDWIKEFENIISRLERRLVRYRNQKLAEAGMPSDAEMDAARSRVNKRRRA